MNLRILQPQAHARRSRAGFTMVEIAMALGVMAFALVAIIGVLPTGIRVQKDNFEDTLINQDGTFLLESIRSGARGLDELTNYFDTISISNSVRGLTVYTNDTRARLHLTNGLTIIGLLSTPKYVYDADGRLLSQNTVTARVRAINGTPLNRDPGLREFSFAYELTTEIVPLDSVPPGALPKPPASTSQAEILLWNEAQMRARLTRYNAWEVRLNLAWPLYQVNNQYRVGGNRKQFRTLTPGTLAITNGLSFLQPGRFSAFIDQP